MKKIVLALVLVSMPAQAVKSDLGRVWGVKHPSSAEEGFEPVTTTVLSPVSEDKLPGFSSLVPFAMRSPNQEDAGSCLYMSLTGIAEWWLAKLHPTAPRTPDGPIDLSERYLMNLAGVDEDSNGIANWKTDSIYLFNQAGGSLRNVDFRFTKSWYSENEKGDYVASHEGAEGAEYGTPFNWINDLASVSKKPKVRLPEFQREILFADPESNQWNTGIAPVDIVDRIKEALVKNQAPVHVIYNHYGYWHATVILGFDDTAENDDCSFTQGFFPYMKKKAAEYRAQATRSKDSAEKEKLLKRAEKTERAERQARESFERQGGCHKGAFYVRDSLYGDSNGPSYDYDPMKKGDEASYVKRTVLLEYEWVKSLANHVTQIVVR